ncbi:hypothetical protein ACFVAV_33470 [Nocardia sp. NPDC057663]|uniref:hypothetical protein n=1 Tax=Nocardia sp. NPDC057663 TaxID=3346201 RepID=UPI0036702C19
MAKKSASELADELAGLGEEIRQRATEEARKYVALAIEEMFLGGPKVNRKQFDNRSPEDCIFEFLEEQASLQSEPTLKAALNRLDESGISDDFRAGILFACRLFADPDFDY